MKEKKINLGIMMLGHESDYLGEVIDTYLYVVVVDDQLFTKKLDTHTILDMSKEDTRANIMKSFTLQRLLTLTPTFTIQIVRAFPEESCKVCINTDIEKISGVAPELTGELLSLIRAKSTNK